MSLRSSPNYAFKDVSNYDAIASFHVRVVGKGTLLLFVLMVRNSTLAILSRGLYEVQDLSHLVHGEYQAWLRNGSGSDQCLFLAFLRRTQ